MSCNGPIRLTNEPISGFRGTQQKETRLRSAPCLKDCFNPCICWSFLVSPCLSSAPKSFLSWAKGSVKAFVGSNPRSNRKKTNPQQRCLPSVSVFPDEIYPAPRSWTEKAYPKLIYYNRLPKGGHFAAWEQPQLFSEELRLSFRSLR